MYVKVACKMLAKLTPNNLHANYLPISFIQKSKDNKVEKSLKKLLIIHMLVKLTPGYHSERHR